MKPRLFIGSSAESVGIAYAAQQNLHHAVEVTVWDQGVFKLSSTAVESLLNVLDRSDFGMFVFSPDDLVSIRGKESLAVRDNVLFELGLFLGRLGRRRCFILVPEGEPELRIATDLLGVTPGTYETGRSDGSLQAATAPACSSIREAVNSVGMRLSDTDGRGAVPQPQVSKEEAQTEAQAQMQADSSTNEEVEYAWLDAYFKQEYVIAAQLLQESMPKWPEEEQPFLQGWLGRIKYSINPGEGVSYFEQLISNDPKNPNRYTDIAYEYIGSDLYEDAIAILDRGLEVVPNDASLILAKVRCLKEIGCFEQLITLLKTAIEESGQAEFYVSLGNHFEEQGDYAQARTWLELGITRLPNNLELLSTYAKVLGDHFDKKLSLVPFEKLVRLAPKNPNFLSLRANVLLELDFNNLAMREYQKANEIAKEEQGWILGNIGNLYKNRGLYVDAACYLNKALEKNSDSKYAHERLAIAMDLSEQENQRFSKLLKEARIEIYKTAASSNEVKAKAEPTLQLGAQTTSPV